MGSEVDTSIETPEAMWERAQLCEEARRSIAETLGAMRELEDQDGTLPALKVALAKEQNRLEDRVRSLRRRRDGMLAE